MSLPHWGPTIGQERSKTVKNHHFGVDLTKMRYFFVLRAAQWPQFFLVFAIGPQIRKLWSLLVKICEGITPIGSETATGAQKRQKIMILVQKRRGMSGTREPGNLFGIFQLSTKVAP